MAGAPSASSSSSTTSRSSRNSTARSARRNSSKASGSPSSRACRRCSARSSRSNSTASPARGSPTACRTSRAVRRRASASSSRCTPTSSTTARRSCCVHTGSQNLGCAVDRLVGHLRPRLGEPEPARLHRAHLRRQESRRRQIASGAPATCHPSIRACSAAPQGEPVLYLDESRRHLPRRSAAARSTRWTELNQHDRRGSRRSGNRHPHRPV